MRPEFSYFFATGQWTALALFLNLANLPCLGYLPIQETLVFCQFCLAIFRQRKTEPVWDKVHVHFEMSAVSILGANPRRWWQLSLETAARQKRTPHDLWKWWCLCPNFTLFVHLHFCKLQPKIFWRCVVCSLDPSHCELQWWLTSWGAASGLSWSCATNEKISWMAVVLWRGRTFEEQMISWKVKRMEGIWDDPSSLGADARMVVARLMSWWTTSWVNVYRNILCTSWFSLN